MDQEPEFLESPSYFWSCLTLSQDCPFFSDIDPNLHYFALGVLALYGAFILMVLSDVSFFWSIGNLQQQVDYYINLVRTKVRRVQLDQCRLMSTNERTEKQLKRTQECKRIVTALRGALLGHKGNQLQTLTSTIDDSDTLKNDGLWSNVTSLIDF